jgi:hypothetical protein
MTGAARELSGPKDNPRSSRSRFRGCRRYSQIHHPTSHAIILSMMGWQPQDWRDYVVVCYREVVSYFLYFGARGGAWGKGEVGFDLSGLLSRATIFRSTVNQPMKSAYLKRCSRHVHNHIHIVY